MTDNESLNQHAERLGHLEGINEEFSNRLNDMNSRISEMIVRLNFQIGLTFAVWATVAGVLSAVLLKS
ncbi:MAG: hypothetical protein IIC21_06265 [Chloroflexi bacterium]|nr:hypothetical protein [Chloroflexota bacterium]